MLGSPCSPCCAFCGCDIPPAQVLLTPYLPDGVGLRGLYSSATRTPTRYYFEAADRLLIQQACVATRDDSAAPAGGYGYTFSQSRSVINEAGYVEFYAGGGGGLSGGFQQGWVSKPGLAAAIAMSLRAMTGTLVAKFVAADSSLPQADRNGTAYCVLLTGSVTQEWALWDLRGSDTALTTDKTFRLTFNVASLSTLPTVQLNGYPALYRSSATIFPNVNNTAGLVNTPRTAPSPYLCLPDIRLPATCSVSFLSTYTQTIDQEQYVWINTEFAGSGKRLFITGYPALPP
jgi:hypothetical protein